MQNPVSPTALLKEKMPVKEIAEITDLSVEEIKKLK